MKKDNHGTVKTSGIIIVIVGTIIVGVWNNPTWWKVVYFNDIYLKYHLNFWGYFLIISGTLVSLVKQNIEIKKLKHQLKEYHEKKILPIERLAFRARHEAISVIEKVLNKDQIEEMDKYNAEWLEEFNKAKKDPLSENYEKDWFD